jgi:hypothetical protein
VAQRTGNGGGTEGGVEVCWARRRASDMPTKKKRERGSSTEMRAKIESRQACRGKRGIQCKGEASAAPCYGHASMTHMGPTTDGFRRTHRDSDPASAERSPGLGATSHWCSKYSGPLVAILSCTDLSYRRRPGHTCFFQNPAISVAIKRALLHQPIVDFPLEHKDILPRRMW